MITFCREGGERLSGGIDLAQDVFALGLPHITSRIFIARRQEGDDRVGQFSGRGKALLGNELGEVAEEALDQIHPGGRGRRVVHVKAGVAIEPSGDRGMLMGGVIVGDDVDGEIAWGLFIDGFEKSEPLLMARLPRRRPGARRQVGDQFALEIIERGKQEPAPAEAGVSVPCRT